MQIRGILGPSTNHNLIAAQQKIPNTINPIGIMAAHSVCSAYVNAEISPSMLPSSGGGSDESAVRLEADMLIPRVGYRDAISEGER